jgi:hypothetical protein
MNTRRVSLSSHGSERANRTPCHTAHTHFIVIHTMHRFVRPFLFVSMAVCLGIVALSPHGLDWHGWSFAVVAMLALACAVEADRNGATTFDVAYAVFALAVLLRKDVVW